MRVALRADFAQFFLSKLIALHPRKQCGGRVRPPRECYDAGFSKRLRGLTAGSSACLSSSVPSHASLDVSRLGEASTSRPGIVGVSSLPVRFGFGLRPMSIGKTSLGKPSTPYRSSVRKYYHFQRITKKILCKFAKYQGFYRIKK